MPEAKARKSATSSQAAASNVIPIGEMHDEAELCPRCLGTGMEILENGSRQCSCRKADPHDDKLKRAQLPRRYDACHFHNYKPKNPSQTAALRFAMNFAIEYPAVDRGLLFMGTVGVGKTHLAVSILKGLTERGFTCLFREFGSLLKEIQDSYNPHTFASEISVLSPVLKADVLVLDELGASKPTDWVRDTLGHIINSRYNDRKITIFTTNYLDERPTEREETLEDRIGVRTRSRLYEMCKSIEISGPDHRRTIDRANVG